MAEQNGLTSIFSLLKTRFYLPLFITQFLGAFNDNAFKLAILTLISYQISQSQQQSEFYQALAGALYTLPFFLFSALAGQMADRFNKAPLTRWIKLWELILMMFGAYALYSRDIMLMLSILTGMGIHSTFFGPIKYAILPQHLPERNLLAATALIESSTFIAILSGTLMGVLSVAGEDVFYAMVLINAVALLGLIASFFIPDAPSTEPTLRIDWLVPRATYTMLRQIFRNRPVVPVILAISWFWFLGVVAMSKLPDFTHYVLGADQQVFAIFLALFSIGIALGSLTINLLQKGAISLRYVAGIMCFISLFALDLYYASRHLQPGSTLQNMAEFLRRPENWRVMFDFFFFSFAGGMYVVPLYTFLQVHGLMGQKSRTIAANNIINAVFMVLGSILVMILLKWEFSIPAVFLVLAILNAVMACWIGVWFYRHRS
ncbi:MAG: MFS transporter [Legionellaceae bacterium]|nr:MFS transporter [Legionellaceae bacterium]